MNSAGEPDLASGVEFEMSTTKALTWRRDGVNWLLFSGKRRMGRVVPDLKWPGMWRVRMPDGWVSDMTNLARAKDAAIRSILFVLNRKETARNRPPVARTGQGVAAPREAVE